MNPDSPGTQTGAQTDTYQSRAARVQVEDVDALSVR